MRATGDSRNVLKNLAIYRRRASEQSCRLLYRPREFDIVVSLEVDGLRELRFLPDGLSAMLLSLPEPLCSSSWPTGQFWTSPCPANALSIPRCTAYCPLGTFIGPETYVTIALVKTLPLASIVILVLVAPYACGGGGRDAENAKHARHVAVSVSPTAASVQVSQSQQFTANVSGTANTAVTWSVSGIAGGNSTVGTVDSSGFYTAPSRVPGPSITVTADSVAQPAVSASAAVILMPPPPVTVTISPNSVSLQLGQTEQFSAAVSGTGNTAVNWLVNGAIGGSPAAGMITPNGLYTTPSSVPTGSVTVSAQSVYDSASYANASVALTQPVAHQVSLSWSASASTVAGYYVYRSMQAGTGYARINPTLDTATVYIDGKVSSGQYFYAVTAVDSNGVESGYSNVAQATVP